MKSYVELFSVGRPCDRKDLGSYRRLLRQIALDLSIHKRIYWSWSQGDYTSPIGRGCRPACLRCSPRYAAERRSSLSMNPLRSSWSSIHHRHTIFFSICPRTVRVYTLRNTVTNKDDTKANCSKSLTLMAKPRENLIEKRVIKTYKSWRISALQPSNWWT